MYKTFCNTACAYYLVQIASLFKVHNSESLLDFLHFPICTGSLFHYNQLAEWNQIHILAYSCALHCVGCESDSSKSPLRAYFFFHIVKRFLCICWVFMDLAHWRSWLRGLSFLLSLKCHCCALLCYQLISLMWVYLESHPCFVSFTLFEGCPFIEDSVVTVCMLTLLWPHVCCSLSFLFCFFFFPSASSWDNPEQSHPPHGK